MSAEIYTHAGMKVEIEYDDTCESPRDYYGNLAVMVLDHRRYTLPCEDEQAKRALDYFTERNPWSFAFRAFARYARLFLGATVVLPVYGYDHGTLVLRAGRRDHPFNDPWDSGIAGVVYDSAETRADLRDDVTTEDIAKYLSDEVDLYSQWSQGDCYGYVVTDPETGAEESCWGYIGIDTAREEANAVAEGMANDPSRKVPSGNGWA